ncbi:MAG: methionyl-tRNA formyltransferase [Deltaproteobacteria bacterium]|nr:methionyl-tRNA formyltransferase [Deltaproteobacteria bacterium]
MGTPDFAAESLRAIVKSSDEVAVVVTQPDKPKGRGMVFTPPPVKVLAQEYNMPVLQPERIKEDWFIERLKDISPDIIVVAAYGRILPKTILEIPQNGCINVHASLLPKYRGAAPINWAIINGENQTGITTMLMDEGMDTGRILLKEMVLISKDDTAGTLHDKLKEVGAAVLLKTIDAIRCNAVIPIEQDNSMATYAPVLKKIDCRIDWNKDAASIRNFVRGLNPLPCAFTHIENRLFKIYSGFVKSDKVKEATGTVVDVSSDGIEVAAKDSIFVITELKPENRDKMSAGEFIRGYKIGKGQILN